MGEGDEVFGFVSKPYRQADMARMVRAALDYRKETRARASKTKGLT